jgi:predicted phosphodiesterase
VSKVLAIGDIHTKQWIIHDVARVLDLFDRVIFCGDYADNWNAGAMRTIETWGLLRELMQSNHDKVYAVIGNHDYAYIHPEIAGHSSGWNQATFTLINAPENKKLKNWLLTLPVELGIDGVVFSHAGITEAWDGDESVYGLWDNESPIWVRPKEFGGYNTVYRNIKQVIGHNPSKKIWNPAPNVWCIDVFSETPDNTPIGDQTMLKIIDGEKFTVVNIKEILNENNSNTPGIENPVS